MLDLNRKLYNNILMIKSKYTSMLVLIITLVTLQTRAATYMKLGTAYMAEDNGGNTRTRLLLDIGGGWIANSGFSLGFLYSSEKNSISNGASADRTAIGPNIGYASKKESGWYALGTYFYSATTTTELKGTGNQIDIGYKFLINKVSFAPQLSKKQFTYTSQYGNDLNSNYTEGRVDPGFVMWLDF